MNDFADEARSRTARLLRMANTADERTRARIIEYANTTPEPPIMGPFGIGTTGCPRCRSTMWKQRDAEGPIWVCASCGHVKGVAMECPTCQVLMELPGDRSGTWSCPTCSRTAVVSDDATATGNGECGRAGVCGAGGRSVPSREHGRAHPAAVGLPESGEQANTGSEAEP